MNWQFAIRNSIDMLKFLIGHYFAVPISLSLFFVSELPQQTVKPAANYLSRKVVYSTVHRLSTSTIALSSHIHNQSPDLYILFIIIFCIASTQSFRRAIYKSKLQRNGSLGSWFSLCVQFKVNFIRNLA